MNETKNGIKELRLGMKMNRKEFSSFFQIPYRTIQDWEADRRIAPSYLLRLMAYMAAGEAKIDDKERSFL